MMAGSKPWKLRLRACADYQVVSAGAFFAYLEHPFLNHSARDVAMGLAQEAACLHYRDRCSDRNRTVFYDWPLPMWMHLMDEAARRLATITAAQIDCQLMTSGLWMSFEIKIWGCRGSIPVASPDHISFGGSTACVEININGHTVIIDAGSGIRELGTELMKRGTAWPLLLSHGHYDHLMGLPFFYPVYKTDMQLHLVRPHQRQPVHARHSQLHAGALPAGHARHHVRQHEFHDIREGDEIDLGNGITAVSCATNHPGGCLAWRVTDGKAFVYRSDHEHGDKVDASLTAFSKDADVMVYDAMYTDGEYPSKKGFGHSTWRKACEFAQQPVQTAPAVPSFAGTHRRTARGIEAGAKIFPAPVPPATANHQTGIKAPAQLNYPIRNT